MSKLFSKITVNDLEFNNRVVMAPMCTYSSDETGEVQPWHMVHYVTRAVGGVGLIILEATSVEKRGRISPNDLGIWNDSQVKGLKNLVEQCHSEGAKVAVQLGHAGRKYGADGEVAIAPSPIDFSERYETPSEMSKEDINTVIQAFKEAARRADIAGFDSIQLHGAHGYLINQFISPLANTRTDEYGGSLENRARFLLEVLEEVNQVWPKEKPIMLRVSAEEYKDHGNHPEDLVKIINLVKDKGLDIIDVSSGGVVMADINVYPGYQLKFSEIIRKGTGLKTIAGGLVTVSDLAESALQNEQADFIFLGRELLRNPYWALHAPYELNDEVEWPFQYKRSRVIRKG
ncbi:NADPH dehydrogenase NamA [Haloplasma contractile]|uniref:NADPH dehydrogenase protein n=1 Tax=Haloplasma contractile SSD-17B TaxID=1033810 RepID=U2EB92_9MOLU|nr:NADPH dehydrogenase NamA [Haloplasma contractile]ERJ12056.1 NADPH dehydrogenase protein [Haloplasma contractile SSD-17B]